MKRTLTVISLILAAFSFALAQKPNFTNGKLIRGKNSQPNAAYVIYDGKKLLIEHRSTIIALGFDPDRGVEIVSDEVLNYFPDDDRKTVPHLPARVFKGASTQAGSAFIVDHSNLKKRWIPNTETIHALGYFGEGQGHNHELARLAIARLFASDCRNRL